MPRLRGLRQRRPDSSGATTIVMPDGVAMAMSVEVSRRRTGAWIAAGLVGLFAFSGVPSARQDPQAPPRQPVFRAGVDVTQLDVTVLDKNRRPIHGLGPASFTVTENGKVQTIVGVSEVVLPTVEDLPAAWLRLVPLDVDSNFLGDRLRDGRIIVVVMDDAGVPFDEDATIESARGIGRSVVDRLGPTDLASVVYTRDAGLSQDFTSDRDKLVKAIEAFQPSPPDSLPRTPVGGYAKEGDMQRHDEANRWSRCEQAHPAIPTLLAVTRTLASITKRRKTIIDITAARGTSTLSREKNCGLDLGQDTRDLYALAERANVNIYPVDPSGVLAAGPPPAFMGAGVPRGPGRAMAPVGGESGEALTTLAVNTGGRAVVHTDDFDGELDHIFAENASYYLIGYQSTDQQRDGKFRQVDVHVTTPGATVLSRRGYYGPTATKAAPDTADAVSRTDLLRVGLSGVPGQTLRVTLAPFALPPADAGPRKAAVVMTLGIREPRPVAPATDVVTVITSATKDGETLVTNFEPHAVTIPLQPNGADSIEYEWTSRLDLVPGRYEIRFNTHSKLFDTGASVFGDVEVPDFSKPGVTLSGMVFGTERDQPPGAEDPIGSLRAMAPTSERSLARGEHVTALVKVYQGGTGPIAAVLLKAQVLDAKNAASFSDNVTLNPDQFDAARSSIYRLDLSPLNLKPGPLLLDIQALMADGSTARRDVPFTIR
jgi:VWFA-related protein